MSSQDLHELHEAAEHARGLPSLAPVSLSMAILAVVVATVSLLGHRAHTKEVIIQNEISDGWAHYQAKAIRRHEDQMFIDLTSAGGNAATSKLQQKYSVEAERYRSEMADLDKEARNLEAAKKLEEKKADFYDFGEALLEISLVITSITLLTTRRLFWYFGSVIGLSGLVVVALGYIAK